MEYNKTSRKWKYKKKLVIGIDQQVFISYHSVTYRDSV